MRINRSQKFLIVTNCVLIAIVAWGLLAERPLLESTAHAQGSQSSASQRVAMVRQLEQMNDQLADLVKGQKAATKATDKQFRDLGKLLKEGQVRVVVSEGHRSR